MDWDELAVCITFDLDRFCLYQNLTPEAFVVTSNSSSLVGLVSAQRKGKAEPEQDQSKVSFHLIHALQLLFTYTSIGNPSGPL